MRQLARVAFGLTLLVALGCGSKPKDMVVGKWEATEPKEAKEMATIVEFKPDGTMVFSMSMLGKTISANGKYKFTADDIVEMEMEPPAEVKGAAKETKKAKVEVTKDNLTLTEQDGKKEVLKLKKAEAKK